MPQSDTALETGIVTLPTDGTIELRVRHQLTPRMGLDVGYVYFMPGDFVSNTAAAADDSDFLYVQVTWRF